MQFSQLNIAHWINKVFLPSSAGIINPGEMEERVRITQRALPPSMAMEPRRFQTRQVIGAPASSLVTMPGPLIDDPRFWWVHACDLSLLTAAPATDYFAFIFLKQQGVVGQGCTLAVGVGAALDGLVYRIGIRGVRQSALGTVPFGGNGGGSFLLAPGYEITGNTSVAPAGAGTLVLTAMFTEFLLGEEIPSVS